MGPDLRMLVIGDGRSLGLRAKAKARVNYQSWRIKWKKLEDDMGTGLIYVLYRDFPGTSTDITHYSVVACLK